MSEKLDQKVIDLLDKAGEHAFEVMVEQMNTNPGAIEALYGDGTIFCQWVDSRVDFTDLPDACKESAQYGKCTACQRSPQLDIGMTPAELIRNIKV